MSARARFRVGSVLISGDQVLSQRPVSPWSRAFQEPIILEARELRQVAQMIHQGYHGAGTWETCAVGACERVRSLLNEAGYNHPASPAAEGREEA